MTRSRGKRGTTALLAAAVAAAVAVAAPGARAQPAPPPSEEKTEPYVILRADEVIYDRDEKRATARGNVEISQGERVLMADTVTFNERTDTITATGEVVLLEPDGQVLFGDNAEFTNQMKDGIVEGFRMLFTDNSRLAATGARRADGIFTRLRKAVFSPCKLCEDDPTKPPLWQIRAVSVVHDDEKREVEYEDAFLEIYGVPVAYVPYFSHPDPRVKRRSGFLAPSYGTDTDFGLFLSTPYFWELAPNEDVTITPVFYSSEADLFIGEYRRRFASGELKVEGSYTQPDDERGGNDDRGHIRANGRFDLDRIWRTRFQLENASDDTFLRRYGLGEPSNRTLTSSVHVEGFKGRNYAQISGFRFQGLREEDDPGETPLIAPFAEYNYVYTPEEVAGRLTADASVLSLTRSEGADSRRLSLKGGWHVPYTADSGEIYSLSATLQGDAYVVNDVTPDSGTAEDGVTGRLFPQLKFQWQYPLVREERTATQMVEPIAAVVVAPNGGNPDEIPNEDSQDIEFDDTNLFSANRFPGVDRVEGGQRVVYGINWGLYGHEGGLVEAFVGQSYRLQSKSLFAEGSGLRDQQSDIVGRLRANPANYLDLLYRFRFDPDGIDVNRNEVRLVAGPPGFRLSSNYLFISEEAGTGEFGDREEISGRLDIRFTDYWSGFAHIREDLTEDGGTISEGLGVVYEDECTTFKATFTREFTRDRDLEPTDTLFFQVIFKHLGEFASGG